MEQNVDGQVNDIIPGPLRGLQDLQTLESIKSSWARNSTMRACPLPLHNSASILLIYLEGLIRHDDSSYQKGSTLRAELSQFLANETDAFMVDDCVRWQLLNNLAGRCDTTETSALLEEILIEIRPILAFIPAANDYCDLSVLGCPIHRQTRSFFKWECNEPSHHVMVKRLFSKTTAPFFQAVEFGYVSTVTHIINYSQIYFDKRPLENGGSSFAAAKDGVNQLLGLRSPKSGGNSARGETALEIAFKNHDATFQSPSDDVERDSAPSKYSEIINCLLDFDRTLVTKDAAFQNAIHSANSDIVRLMLEHAPHDFLPESTVAEELAKPEKNVADVLLTSWCQIKPISLPIAKKMIQAERLCIWETDSIKDRFKEFARGRPNDAKELLNTAIDKNTPAIASEILDISPESFDQEMAKKLVRHERWEFWELKELKELKKTWESVRFPELLSLAVRHQRARVVKQLVKDSPSSVLHRYPGPKGTVDEIDETREVYPLWHNNFVIKDDFKKHRRDLGTENLEEAAIRRNIRNTLVSACTRLTENVQTLCDIFQHSGESVGDISFDLSQFNSRFYPFDQFVKSLIQRKGEARIPSHRYERTLRYANFPSLDPNLQDRTSDRYQKHTEVIDVLKWLKREQKVEEIVKLKVPDRMSSPHDEENIAWAVREFQVQHLDWRCLDLSFSVFDKPRADCLKTLHLYASGRRAVVSHWLSEEGINSFREIKQLEIHLVKELMSKKQARDLETTLNRHLGELKDERTGFQFEVNIESWDIHPIRSNTTLGHLAERAVPKLWPLIQAYKNHLLGLKSTPGTMNSSWKPTKVAVIDNGIMNIVPFYTSPRDGDATGSGNHHVPLNYADNIQERGEDEVIENAAEVQEESSEDVSQALLSRVVQGQSFLADEDRVGSWSFASDPHGTQMASLICAIDPHCEILVAKVIEGRFGLHSERLAMAIRWAVLQGADIISMSLATYELGRGEILGREVIDAHTNGVLLLCAAHDEGLNVTKAYPAGMSETLTIAASNQFGHATDRMAKPYDYRIHATNIAVGAVPFMHSEEYISGSSVATAIAAGMSSLIISCRRLATGLVEDPVKTWKRKIVERKFDDARPSEVPEQNYVRLDNLCRMDERTQDGKPLDMDDVIEQEFMINLLVSNSRP